MKWIKHFVAKPCTKAVDCKIVFTCLRKKWLCLGRGRKQDYYIQSELSWYFHDPFEIKTLIRVQYSIN